MYDHDTKKAGTYLFLLFVQFSLVCMKRTHTREAHIRTHTDKERKSERERKREACRLNEHYKLKVMKMKSFCFTLSKPYEGDC